MYNTGARVSEMSSLRQVQISFGVKSYVHLHGKGRKERSVPLWSRTARTIKECLREIGRNDSTLVFPNGRGEPLSRFATHLLLRKAVQRAVSPIPLSAGRDGSRFHRKHDCGSLGDFFTRTGGKKRRLLSAPYCRPLPHGQHSDLYAFCGFADIIRNATNRLVFEFLHSYMRADTDALAWAVATVLRAANYVNCP